MALIEEAIGTRLAAVSGLTALVGSNLFPVQIPQLDAGGTLDVPAVVWQLISDPPEHSHQGLSMANPRYEVTSWATTYASAKQVANQVKLALDGFSGTVSVDGYSPAETVKIFCIMYEDQRDLFDDETRLYGISQDYFIKHQAEKS